MLRAQRRENYTILNPGSVALPKEGNIPTYAVLEDGVFTWKDVETGKAYKEAAL